MADAIPDSVARSSSRPAHHRRWLRWSTLATLLLTLLLTLLFLGSAFLIRLTFVHGWWRTIRIAGGSMAQTYLGPHWDLVCRECGKPFRCGVEHPPDRDSAVCPNCGCPDNPVHPAEVRAGDRVWIDGWSRQLHGLRTWQAVAFPQTATPDVLTVKRLVARGPGSVAIRDGDIYLNDAIQRKDLEVLREVCVLVHDDAFRSPRGRRWQPSSNRSRWTPTSIGYTASSADSPDSDLDWLNYTQWTCWPNDDPRRERTQDVSIVDHDSYSQGFARGALNEVADLYLSCTLQLASRSRCVLRIISRRDVFTWEFDTAAGKCRFARNGAVIGECPFTLTTTAFQVEMAVCDQRLFAAISQAMVFEQAYDPDTNSTQHDDARVSIGAGAGSITVFGLRLARDVFYTGPYGTSDWEAPQSLTTGQWFVLGDNLPVTVDSRLWSGINAETILGPVRRRDR